MIIPTSSVLVAGYTPLDIIQYGERTWHSAGGTAGNVAAILAFLGWDAAVAADLGKDPAGKAIVRDFQKSNVDVAGIRLRESISTPRVIHQVLPSDHRFIFTCPICESRFPRSRPLQRARAEELFCTHTTKSVFFFDRVNSGTVRLAEMFGAAGKFVVFEPSRASDSDLMRRSMAAASLIKVAHDRDIDLGESPSRPNQIQVRTKGSDGADVRVGDGSWQGSPAFPYPVVDAGGAGDWTTAGMLHALRGSGGISVRTVADALRWGQALAAVSCGAPGARGLVRQQTAEAVLRAVQFLQHEQAGTSPGWADMDAGAMRRRKGYCRQCLMPKPDEHRRRSGAETAA